MIVFTHKWLKKTVFAHVLVLILAHRDLQTERTIFLFPELSLCVRPEPVLVNTIGFSVV